MIKYLLYISFFLLSYNLSSAQNVDIQEDIEIGFVCELEKKINLSLPQQSWGGFFLG